MSTATKAFGSILSFSLLGVTYTAIAQTKDLTGPEPEVGAINITNNDSPNNAKEYIPGMIEPGEQSFDVVYRKADCATLYALFGDGNIYFLRETYPDGSKWEYKGFFTRFGTEGETEDGVLTNNISIKLTTKPAFTAGT